MKIRSLSYLIYNIIKKQNGQSDNIEEEHILRVAIVGRPNAGKSPIVNSLNKSLFKNF